MSKKKTLFLLRHGKTGFPGCYIGSRDVPLSPEGILQVGALRTTLQNHRFDTILISPMLRCQQTCDIIFPDTSVKSNDNLREVDFGRWEGLTFEQIVEQDPEIVTEWAGNVPGFIFPEGESVASFRKRTHKIATELSQMQGKKILVICHGGVIRGLLCHFLGIDPRSYLMFQVKKGTYSTVDLFEEQGVLTGFNLQ